MKRGLFIGRFQPFHLGYLKDIKNALNEVVENYTIFPIPDFSDDEKWVEHIEALVPKFDIVFTGNYWTERCFKKKGCKVKKIKLIEDISSTIIRNRILKNE